MKGVIKLAPNKVLDNLLNGISKGSKYALNDLYVETKTAVYAYALSILKNKENAEDVLQETYITIWEKIDTYRSSGKPLAWILTITKNLALMKFRKEKKNVDIDLYKDILSKESDNTIDKLFLSKLFEELSDDEREIVILHAVSGFKHREIARIMNISIGTVLSKYKRTIEKLKRLAKEELHEQ